MTGSRVALCVAATVLFVGCATRLVPAPGAARLDDGRGSAAVAHAGGVRMVARVNAWRGYPDDLAGELEPVLVTVENDSGRHLRVRYEQFTLVAPAGKVFVALAPFDVQGAVRERVPSAFAAPELFHAGPRFWPHARLGYGYPFGWDPFYGHGDANRWIELPTGDMVQKALPETTIEPGGRARGFLYFQNIENVDAVTFRAVLVDARSGQPFATIEIPFVVE